MQTSIVYFYLQIRSVTSKSIVIRKHEKYLYQTKRTKGGARDTFQGGHCRLSLDTGFEKKQGRTPKYYLIYIILNPDDPLLETLIDYRLISTYWKIDSMWLNRISIPPLLLFALRPPPQKKKKRYCQCYLSFYLKKGELNMFLFLMSTYSMIRIRNKSIFAIRY